MVTHTTPLRRSDSCYIFNGQKQNHFARVILWQSMPLRPQPARFELSTSMQLLLQHQTSHTSAAHISTLSRATAHKIQSATLCQP